MALDGRPSATAALLDGPRQPPCPARGAGTPLDQADGGSACYARPDGGAHESRGALTAHVLRAVATPPATHDRGRGGRLLPGLSRAQGGSAGGPAAGGDSRAPPRHRQGAATPIIPCARSDTARPVRPGSARSVTPSWHAPWQPIRSCASDRPTRRLGQRWPARGAHRGVCGQARHAARGLTRATLRAMAPEACGACGGPGPGAAAGGAARDDAVHRHRRPSRGGGAAALGGGSPRSCRGQRGPADGVGMA